MGWRCMICDLYVDGARYHDGEEHYPEWYFDHNDVGSICQNCVQQIFGKDFTKREIVFARYAL